MEMRYLQTAEQFLSENIPMKEWKPFAAATNREAYEALPADYREKMIARGEAHICRPFPALRATDFMAFTRTGNRTDYETLYFAKRHQLNDLVVAECMEGTGRFLDDIVDGIFSLCEETAWQLPAHNTYPGDTAPSPLADATHPLLDLFACETGAQLACIHYLLGEALDQISPMITLRIRKELHRRIITPYLDEHFWWMGDGEKPMCNWTAWCTQNVLRTVFFLDVSEEIKCAVLRKASMSLDCFLKDYGDDGCCDEGPLYFRRAGLCLHAATGLMNAVTDGAYSPLYEWPKIRNIAAYICNVHIDGKYYFNFADSAPVAGRAGVREYTFGLATQNPFLVQFAAADYQAATDEELYGEEIYLLDLSYRMQDAFLRGELLATDTISRLAPKDVYYNSIGLFLARSTHFSLAVKAGDNDDNHNHNDTGSLILYRDGRPILIDIGVESYTAKTFSADRYSIWTMQSGYHNLPTICGIDEAAGADYRATNVDVRLDVTSPSIAMELASAYPLLEEGFSYRRSVILDKEKEAVTLQDSANPFDGDHDIILNFITYDRPIPEGPLLHVGEATLSYAGASLLAIETLPITDARLRASWDHDLTRIRLQLTEEIFTLTIR